VKRAALLALAAGACWHGGAGNGPRAAASDPRDDSLAYMPADAQIVIVGDGARMRASAAWKRIDAAFGDTLGPARGRFAARCGYDPLGFERVTVGIKRLDAAQPSMVFVVRGIDPARLEACLTGELRAVVTRDGDSWHVAMPFGHPMQLATLGSTAVAYVGPDANAAALHALLASGAPLRHDASFMQLAGELPDDAAMWSIGRGLAWRGPATFAAAITFDAGAAFVGRATFADPGEADKMRSWASRIPSSIATIEVAVDGATARVHARLTAAQLDAIVRRPLNLF